MVVFVSMFLLSDSNNRTPEKYFYYFNLLAQSGIKLILYLDKQFQNTFEDNHIRTYKNVVIADYISIDKSWLGEYTESQIQLPLYRNTEKDTLNYLSIQLMKLKLVADATKYTDSQYLSWIDFGIFHLIKDINIAYLNLNYISSKTDYPTNKIISPSPVTVTDPSSFNTKLNIWNNIFWEYCGSFLIGHRDLFHIAHEKQMELVKCGLPAITWEINYWYMMRELFLIYPGNHNDSILNIHTDTIFTDRNTEINREIDKAMNMDMKMVSQSNIPDTSKNNTILTDIEIINFVKPYTSLSHERIQNVLDLVSSCIKNNIPGDFIEIGVWKGGVIMAMALKCHQMGTIRQIHAYDTFTGMTTPGNVDIDINGSNAADILQSVACVCHLNEFKNNMELLKNVTKSIPNNIIIHVGDITKINTNTDIPEEIALLRLDTDWYESTRFELEFFEPHVVDFGFVIVDDYGHWNGARKAVDEFKPPHINKIDYTGIWWQKDYGRGILELAVKHHPESETARVLLANFQHFIGIYKAIGMKFWHGCGSYMFNGQQYKYQRETLKKQEALFNVGKNGNVRRVLEIGVYLGHSLLILLCANPNLIIDCIDIDGQFSPKAVEYLNKHFGNRVNFILGSAKEKIPELYKIDSGNNNMKYDLIHIDADHYVDAVIEQFNLCKPFAIGGGYIIFDDYEAVRECIDNWIKEGILEHVFTPWCLWTNIVTKLIS